MEKRALKTGLRTWFIIHFILDVLAALPLMIAPGWFLTLLGWNTVDPVTARIVSAALLAIGIESWLARNSTIESFRSLLDLKILWSAWAIIGFVLNLIQNAQNRPPALWGFLAIFAGFHILWVSYRIRVGKALKKPA